MTRGSGPELLFVCLFVTKRPLVLLQYQGGSTQCASKEVNRFGVLAGLPSYRNSLGGVVSCLQQTYFYR
jgi:hypothetical protein